MSIQAMQQALETILLVTLPVKRGPLTVMAINDLRLAIEQAEKQAEKQEPVGQLQEDAFGRGQVMWFKKPADQSMLYTAPPQRQPLTDEQIDAIWHNSNPTNFEARSFARAIERAHGIGGVV